jgi:hypothetical protein
MPSQQNIKYKPIWKDEYLMWIWGFANAHCFAQNNKQIIKYFKDVSNEQ